VVATEEEYRRAKKRFSDFEIIKTGIGAVNVIRALKDLNIATPLLNFGYAGSNVLEIGEEIEIGKVALYHPKVQYKEPAYKLSDSNVSCFTSCDFVTETDIKEPCVFDMELVFILALGFKDVKSIKIVSDNLSIKQYEENTK
jgi:hypothetical protein